MAPITKTLLIAHAVATFGMFGLIWLVQLVQYPLFADVSAETFARYHAGHTTRISLVVIPLMMTELVTMGALLATRPEALPAWSLFLGAALVGVAWASTFFLSVPAHNTLAAGFVEKAHRSLVSTNWIRTLAWTARSALVAWWLARAMDLR